MLLLLAQVIHGLAVPATLADWDPGDAGWGDVLFVSLWAFGSLLLGSFYCYRAYFSRK